MKKRYLYIITILIVFSFCLTGCGDNKKNANINNESNIEVQKISTETSQNKDNYNSIIPKNTQNNAENIKKQPIETEIAKFSTDILDKAENRQHNIKLACSKINGYKLDPEKTFSFNEVVGKTDEQAGYKTATVIIDEETVQDYGGGICQISTTLYNAVLAAEGLEVVERHVHEIPVPYIEKGKDATISENLDFKFKNNLKNSIKIYAEPSENFLTIRLCIIN